MRIDQRDKQLSEIGSTEDSEISRKEKKLQELYSKIQVGCEGEVWSADK